MKWALPGILAHLSIQALAGYKTLQGFRPGARKGAAVPVSGGTPFRHFVPHSPEKAQVLLQPLDPLPPQSRQRRRGSYEELVASLGIARRAARGARVPRCVATFVNRRSFS